MIDLHNGNIGFDAFTLNSSTRLIDIENFITRRAATLNSGAQHVGVGVHLLDDKTWGVGAVVSPFKTKQVWLQMLEAKGVNPNTWDLQNEERRRQVHDSYLKELCHDSSVSINRSISTLKYSFRWGSISSTLDVRGIQALIIIEYND
ncbi:hypothetical protein [Duganella sp. HH105]|uniref:hypothetical protein n=1 Tax=Duganella sp. HH105 TaxID=1781067 RepID=UPI00114D06EF|nr:hypothetical protein [Duganella sp. HH105]